MFGFMRKLTDNRKRLDLSNFGVMVDAYQDRIESYVPVFGNEELGEEGGTSEISYQNLCIIMEKLGRPLRVEVSRGDVVMVYWDLTKPGNIIYLATGFAVGYYGTGPYYLSRFGEKAGFGDQDDLYHEICVMERHHSGLLWPKH